MGFALMSEALQATGLQVTTNEVPTVGTICEGLLDKEDALPEMAQQLPGKFAELVIESNPTKFRAMLRDILVDERLHRLSNPASFEVNADTVRGLRQLIRWHSEGYAPGSKRDMFDSIFSRIRPAGTVHDPLSYLIEHL